MRYCPAYIVIAPPGPRLHLELVSRSGLYVIDDMLPQPNWPEGHAEKAAHLVSTLERRGDFRITKLSWASGVVLASRI